LAGLKDLHYNNKESFPETGKSSPGLSPGLREKFSFSERLW